MENRINVYTCKSCGHQIVTIDIEEGVTPFMIDCKICKKDATSSFYRVPEGLVPTHEWYKPTVKELKKLYGHNANLLMNMKDHVKSGGLDLRKKK